MNKGRDVWLQNVSEGLRDGHEYAQLMYVPHAKQRLPGAVKVRIPSSRIDKIPDIHASGGDDASEGRDDVLESYQRLIMFNILLGGCDLSFLRRGLGILLVYILLRDGV